MNSLGVCTRYDQLGASSRLRYYLYAEAMRQAGIEPRFFPFFPHSYLEKLYQGQKKSRWLAAGGLLRRMAQLPRLPHALLIEYELLPELSADFELARLAGRRYVLNFDDNVWEKYGNRPHLADKFDRLVAQANGVIAANDFLMERVLPLQKNIIKIPTVIDLREFPAKPQKRNSRFTVGWIGTPVTYRYLELFGDHLRAMAAAVDFELLVIARKELSIRAIPGVSMRFENWSQATESALLSGCDAGIMPLTDDAFSRGKSAFKLIQYLAAGLPAIASSVGENRQIIRPGQTGFLANTPQEWADALRFLSQNESDRLQMSEAARTLAFDFSLQKFAPVMTEFLQKRLFS